jgi:hypothetical protein
VPVVRAADPAIERAPFASPKREARLRIAIAALLVGAGFLLGRLTAPTPSVTAGAMAAEPPVPAKAAAIEATAAAINTAPPSPVETAAPLPTPVVVPTTVLKEAVVPAAVRQEPVKAVETPPQPPATAPAAARVAPARPSAPDEPARTTTTTVHAAPPARTEHVEPTEVPPPSAGSPINPFVQAVQDDIKEDEAARTKKK